MAKFNSLLKFLVNLTLWCLVICKDGPAVSTPLGEVRGNYSKTRGGRTISAFTAIPFAEPPIGDLRFKPPVAVRPWKETVDATQPSPLCVQRNPYVRQDEIVGQEDCLYLDIYTPYTENELSDPPLLPVMVWIHGGGWMCGGANMYDPDYLLERDVLLVTINYRLGPLGFLSTQDGHCPGNNGLKDQQEALRFVQKVISSFGGDPHSVTIFGESAGGASVHYHMLSETSEGLFHKAISQSGTALVPWAEAPPGEALRAAFRLAQLLRCPQAPSTAMLACLRSRDSYDIIDTEFSFYVWDYEPMIPFKAVVEPDLPGAFLTRNPRKIPKTRAVPWLTGLTRDEGCLKTGWITTNETLFQEFLSGFNSIAPPSFYYENSPYVDLITKKVWNQYLKRQSPEEIKSGVTDAYTDSYFAYPCVEAVELTFNYTKNPVFLYELTYEASTSFISIFGDPEHAQGHVSHADDLLHLFPISFHSPTPIEEGISRIVVTMWTNFATSGNPNQPEPVPVNWSPATSAQKMEYLEIGRDQTMKKGLASRSRFWGSLPLWHNIRRSRFVDEL